MHERRHIRGLRAADSAREKQRHQIPAVRDRKNAKEMERRQDPAYREMRATAHRNQLRERLATDAEFRRAHRAKIKTYQQLPESQSRKRKQSKAWYHSHKEVQRDRMRRLRYGVTAEVMLQQLTAQEFRCGNLACDTPVNESSAVDHCHTTGQIRGILCTRCNFLEGALDKHTERLLGLLDYRDAGGVWVSGSGREHYKKRTA